MIIIFFINKHEYEKQNETGIVIFLKTNFANMDDLNTVDCRCHFEFPPATEKQRHHNIVAHRYCDLHRTVLKEEESPEEHIQFHHPNCGSCELVFSLKNQKKLHDTNVHQCVWKLKFNGRINQMIKLTRGLNGMIKCVCGDELQPQTVHNHWRKCPKNTEAEAQSQREQENVDCELNPNANNGNVDLNIQRNDDQSLIRSRDELDDNPSRRQRRRTNESEFVIYKKVSLMIV